MNSDDFIYTINKASEQQILAHLSDCDLYFYPPLHTYVNLATYSNKIFANAIRIECWYGGLLVGLVAVYLNDLDSKIGFITNVSVLIGYQGRGIAKTLLLKSFEKAKELGFQQIDLEVYENNSSAIAIYEKLAFKTIEKGPIQKLRKFL